MYFLEKCNLNINIYAFSVTSALIHSQTYVKL